MQTAANGERVKLYVDTDITPKLARTLRAHGYDVVSAHEVGSAEATDREHIDFAAAQGRTLLTCNAQDFTPIFEDYWFAGKDHNGIVVSEQLELGEMLRRVMAFLDSITVDEMRNNWKNLAEFAGRKARVDKKLKEAVATLHAPPKMVHTDWPRAAQVVNEAGSNLQAQLGDVLPKQDIDREIVRLGRYTAGGIPPADYCYNLINRAPLSFRYPVFEWVERGRYRYLGPNYPYTGPIFWRPAGGERQVGEWKDGTCHLREDPRR
jgi:hypothetical protein